MNLTLQEAAVFAVAVLVATILVPYLVFKMASAGWYTGKFHAEARRKRHIKEMQNGKE